MDRDFWIGGYAPQGQSGVSRVRLAQDGSLRRLYEADVSPNPSYLLEVGASDANGDDGNAGRTLYAVWETATFEGANTGAIARYAVEDGGVRLLQAIGSGGTDPCHLSTDDEGRWLFASNYGDGRLAVFAIGEDGALSPHIEIQHEGSGADPERQEGPHAHCAMLTRDRSMLLVCDLGMDALLAYPFNRHTGALAEALRLSFPPGSGPRHIALPQNSRFAYVVHELSSEVSVIALEGMRVLQTLSTLERPVAGNTCAAVKIAGDRLYASNRGDDSVAAFYIGSNGWLTRTAISPVGARTPRDIEIAGEYLLAACQDDDAVVSLRVRRDGSLEPVDRVAAARPACIVAAG